LARLEAAAKKNATKNDKANGDGNWQRLKRSFGTSDRAAGIEDRGIRNAFRVLRMQGTWHEGMSVEPGSLVTDRGSTMRFRFTDIFSEAQPS
jgi:hypothetical protein